MLSIQNFPLKGITNDLQLSIVVIYSALPLIIWEPIIFFLLPIRQFILIRGKTNDSINIKNILFTPSLYS